uniref:NADH dehydrogenase subunit 2 n=1 Tax=Callibia diana TaxID=1777913 RepID=UPI002551CFFB|nr:NADH dehydrogenase subunit 2 [Callibia diana]WFD61143.1 NADH dehydrogenase subunit 2 [Callibia diana]
MPFNSIKILFLLTLISGVLISLCANSWLGAWMGLEINLLSFIPLLTSKNNTFSTEASLKYFLIQVMASSAFLFLILLKMNLYEMSYLMKYNLWNNFMILPLLMKIASSPFHWWLPSIIEGLSWFNCFIMLSIQKIAPMILISYLLISSNFIQIIIMLSAIVGAIGGFNQISLRKIMAFSSINHIGWMLMAMTIGSNLWLNYFQIYTINIIVIFGLLANSNTSFISQTFYFMNNEKLIKILVFISILSLGGLPPLLGFFPKWVMIEAMMQNSLILTAFILVMSSLLTLFYYMRIMYSTLLISSTESTWFNVNSFVKKKSLKIIFTTFFVIWGMLACTLYILTC